MQEKKSIGSKSKTESTSAPAKATADKTSVRKVRKAAAPRATKAPRPSAPAKARPAVTRSRRPAVQADSLSILLIASEAEPFVRTSTVADLAGALPQALARLGHRVTLVIPRYAGIATAGEGSPVALQFGDRTVIVTLRERHVSDHLTVVFVDAPELFERQHLYGEPGTDYPDNAWRFGVFCRAAIEYARLRGERPSVIHAHDWQAGLVPVFQKMLFPNDPVVGGVPVVFTIHNLAFQGVFPASTIRDLALSWEVFDVQALEYWGQISYLKGGINFSERITAVNPHGSADILTHEGGFGFEGVLRRRAEALSGIPSGTDSQSWDLSAGDYVKVYRDAGAGRPAEAPLKAEA